MTYPSFRQGSPAACFITEDGAAWGLQWTPEAARMSGLSWKFAEIALQGRKPLVRRDSPTLRSISFQHPVLASGSDAAMCTRVVAILISLAESGQKVRLVNVSSDIETRGWYYITDLTVNIDVRDEQQQIKMATLSWTLTEANDERPAIARTPPPPPPPAVAAAPSMQADYTVVKGDSLWKIAARFLGDGARWREIFDLNKDRLNLAPPEMYKGLLTVWISAGQVMHIPPR